MTRLDGNWEATPEAIAATMAAETKEYTHILYRRFIILGGFLVAFGGMILNTIF